MIDYETYKRKFGTKDKRGKEYRVGISQDIYDMLSRDNRFGIACQNEITLALVEDVMMHIAECLMSKDKDNELKAWKKVGEVIKKVIMKYRNDDHNLNDRYYKVAVRPEERALFMENPMVIDGDNKTLRVSRVVSGLGMFYRAVSTDVGEAVCQAITDEKKKAIESLYEAKHKNGTSSYYNALNFIINEWIRRVSMYEWNSSELKFINRSMKDARTGK